ncbi:TonB-dependent receptor plug domain-containing protein [Maribacter sp.]|nr:TonB-dependent receptor plug domain-containing protein [Maribacter sp.]
MKTFVFTLMSFLFFSPCFSQTDMLRESTTILKNSEFKPELQIRCGTTSIDQKSPLFIIDGVPVATSSSNAYDLDPNDILSIAVLKGADALACYGSAGANGVVLINTKGYLKVSHKEYPFKVYTLSNDNWTMAQDVYNAIQAKVPSIAITTDTRLNPVPNISMRGDDNTIVIVDGVRYDASILNTLNPSDIESITVAPNVAAANYLRNN